MEDAQQDAFIFAQQDIFNKSNLPIEPPSSRETHKRNHFQNSYPTSSFRVGRKIYELSIDSWKSLDSFECK